VFLDIHVFSQNLICESAWLCLLSYYGNEHFEGAVIATKGTPWWCHLWCVETCCRFANVWPTYFVHVHLVIKIKLITVHRTTTYPVFWRQGFQNSNHSPDTKTQFVDVALTVRKNVEVVPCIRWLHYTSTPTDHSALIILPFDTWQTSLCRWKQQQQQQQ